LQSQSHPSEGPDVQQPTASHAGWSSSANHDSSYLGLPEYVAGSTALQRLSRRDRGHPGRALRPARDARKHVTRVHNVSQTSATTYVLTQFQLGLTLVSPTLHPNQKRRKAGLLMTIERVFLSSGKCRASTGMTSQTCLQQPRSKMTWWDGRARPEQTTWMGKGSYS
jgi:hypothetical protein